MPQPTLQQQRACRSATAATPWPFISVIVPVRNEAAFLADTLRQLLEQRYDAGRFEVIVADGGSTDDTRAIVAALQTRYAHLRLLDSPRQWSSAGRNAAVQAARGDLVLVIDGHCDLRNPHYLRNLADAFATSGADSIGRPQPLDAAGATRLQRAIAAARASRLGHHPASHIYSNREGFVPPESVAIAYRRGVFDAIGLFDERFDACEDVEFNHRLAQAGLTCWFTPRVQVHYHPRANLGGLFRQMVRYGRGRVRLLRKHPETFSLSAVLPAAFLAFVAAGPLLVLWGPLFALLYAGVLGVYGMAVLLFSIALCARQRDARLLPLFPLIFPVIHAGAGAGAWCELLRGPLPALPTVGPASRQSRVWTGETPVPPAASRPLLNALTIDVEDYYHVSGFDRCLSRRQWDDMPARVGDSTRRVLDRLAEFGVRGTFFILGWVAERQPGLVRAIRAAGHEIGCHSYAHRLVYEQTPQQFRVDLRLARLLLEDILGERITAYRAPSFSIAKRSLWALDILLEEGFLFDSSIYPTYHDRYGMAGTPLQPHRLERGAGSLWEFPPPVWRLMKYPVPIGGGGYFRLYPYGVTRRGLRAINASGRPFAVYLHPWEFDPEQPRLRPGAMRAFRHYVGLRRTEPRLVRLLQDFRFGTMSEALGEWLNA